MTVVIPRSAVASGHRAIASLYTRGANRDRLSLSAPKRTQGEHEVPHLVNNSTA